MYTFSSLCHLDEVSKSLYQIFQNKIDKWQVETIDYLLYTSHFDDFPHVCYSYLQISRKCERVKQIVKVYPNTRSNHLAKKSVKLLHLYHPPVSDWSILVITCIISYNKIIHRFTTEKPAWQNAVVAVKIAAGQVWDAQRLLSVNKSGTVLMRKQKSHSTSRDSCFRYDLPNLLRSPPLEVRFSLIWPPEARSEPG